MRHGFLLIDKPAGPTSHDVVSTVRRALGERSIGHLGTLDPAATGLLVLAVGKKALKVIELFAGLSKEYEAGVRCGAVSSTYDREGTIESVAAPAGFRPPDAVQLRRLIEEKFLGHIKQVPPMHSAVHVGGERAYHKARQGKNIDLPSRDVEISACDILSYAYPEIHLRVACGSGTYIRSMAHDLGQQMHCGAYLSSLRRTKVGDWRVEDAVNAATLIWSQVLPLKDVLSSLPRRDLTDSEYEDLRCGRDIEGEAAAKTIGWYEELPVALLEQKGEGNIHARKVL